MGVWLTACPGRCFASCPACMSDLPAYTCMSDLPAYTARGSHSPPPAPPPPPQVSCATVRKWLTKNSAESENLNWILANTKPCPKCHRPIEKNQGCMHMTCSQCRWVGVGGVHGCTAATLMPCADAQCTLAHTSRLCWCWKRASGLRQMQNVSC
jgi:hypothetical protein